MISKIGFSQENKIYLGNIICDSTSIQNEERNIWRNHFSSIFESKNKIEIRIFIMRSNQYISLSYDSSWQLIRHKYNEQSEKYDVSEINDSVKLDKIFKTLVNNNIFSLPDSQKVELGKYYYDLDLNEISGAGIGYSHPFRDFIEFKVGEKYRCYSYYETKEVSNFYPQNIEFKQFLNILNCFNEID